MSFLMAAAQRSNIDVAPHLAVSPVMDTSCFPFFTVTNNVENSPSDLCMSLASVPLGWAPLRGISRPKGGHVLHGSSWFGMPSGAAGPGHRGTSGGKSHLPAPLPPPPWCSTPFVALCASPSPWCLGPSLSQPSKPDGFPSCLPAVPPPPGRRRTRGAS